MPRQNNQSNSRRRRDPKAAAQGARHKHRRKLKRSEIEGQEIEQLEKQIKEQAPQSLAGGIPDEPNAQSYAQARDFEELPISKYTKRALAESNYVSLTAVQQACLPQALCGRDVLGAAKTGSGKTLSFLIPVIERLYRAKWTDMDGIGALIISPTRELALQIFDELRKIGKHHSISAGLLIGGKSAEEEAKFVTGINILVCAPGRLLHHMDSTPGFECNNLQALVLDEADRCLDMGFSATMDAILANLPTERQTLLFSATQSKRVSDLARLSLQDPEYIAVDAEATSATPAALKQFYIQCELHTKLDLLWFFIKTHLKHRTIVFLSTCKQVKFVYEAFRKLRPGVPLAMLHGSMKQMKRFAVFYTFSQSEAMVLFATDIAARGLDFPRVDWVLQPDCPEDAAAYIHRVGRTARFTSSGEALLFLTPSEEPGMLKALEEKRVPIQLRTFSSRKVLPTKGQLSALLAEHEDLKQTAQAAFLTYMRSVHLNPNREIFNISKLDPDAYAASLGLLAAPHQRAVKKMQKHAERSARKGRRKTDATTNAKAAAAVAGGTAWQSLPLQEAADEDDVNVDQDDVMDDVSDDGCPDPLRTDNENPGEVTAGTNALVEEQMDDEGDSSADDSEDILTVRRKDVLGNMAEVEAMAARSKAADESTNGAPAKRKKRKKLKIQSEKGTGSLAVGSRTLFDASGRKLDALEALQNSREDVDFQTPDERFSAHKLAMQGADRDDRILDKQKRRDRKVQKKLKQKEAAAAEAGYEGVTLGGGSDAEEPPSDGGSDIDVEANELEPDRQKKKRKTVGCAYKGMVSDSDDEGDGNGLRTVSGHARRAVRDMGLQEKEELALRLLRGM